MEVPRQRARRWWRDARRCSPFLSAALNRSCSMHASEGRTDCEDDRRTRQPEKHAAGDAGRAAGSMRHWAVPAAVLPRTRTVKRWAMLITSDIAAPSTCERTYDQRVLRVVTTRWPRNAPKWGGRASRGHGATPGIRSPPPPTTLRAFSLLPSEARRPASRADGGGAKWCMRRWRRMALTSRVVFVRLLQIQLLPATLAPTCCKPLCEAHHAQHATAHGKQP